MFNWRKLSWSFSLLRPQHEI